MGLRDCRTTTEVTTIWRYTNVYIIIIIIIITFFFFAGMGLHCFFRGHDCRS